MMETENYMLKNRNNYTLLLICLPLLILFLFIKLIVLLQVNDASLQLQRFFKSNFYLLTKLSHVFLKE